MEQERVFLPPELIPVAAGQAEKLRSVLSDGVTVDNFDVVTALIRTYPEESLEDLYSRDQEIPHGR